MTAVLLLVPVLAAGPLRVANRSMTTGTVAPYATVLLLGLTGWVSYYVFHQRISRSWYLAHLAPLAFTLLLPCAFFTLERLVRIRALASGLQLAVVALLASTSTKDFPTAPQEYDKYRAALEANAYVRDLSEDVRIGAFNAGVYDYFMERDVLNLDGVVNPEALEAHRTHSLARYLVRRNVKVIIDHPHAAGFARIRMKPHYGVRPWIDLTNTYPPFRKKPVKETFLWTVDPTYGRRAE